MKGYLKETFNTFIYGKPPIVLTYDGENLENPEMK